MPPDPIPIPSTPVLQSLRPAQFEFNLVRGEHRSLRLLGQYSDGSKRPINLRATWTSSDSTIAAVRPDDTLAAIDIGICQISVQLDSFAVHPNVLNVEVRLPLADAVRFSPPWNEAALPLAKPQAFITRTAQPYRHAYYWSLNGYRLPVMAPSTSTPPPGGKPTPSTWLSPVVQNASPARGSSTRRPPNSRLLLPSLAQPLQHNYPTPLLPQPSRLRPLGHLQRPRPTSAHARGRTAPGWRTPDAMGWPRRTRPFACYRPVLRSLAHCARPPALRQAHPPPLRQKSPRIGTCEKRRNLIDCAYFSIRNLWLSLRDLS